MDPAIRQRVLLIRSRTDSIIEHFTSREVYKKLNADFGVTYLVGEFYNNYTFLNAHRPDPAQIYSLTQYYFFHDLKLNLRDTIAVAYLELKNRFAPEVYRLEVELASNTDFLKIKALNYLYRSSTQVRLQELLHSKHLIAPTVHLSVDAFSNTWFVLVHEKGSPHYFAL